MVRQARRDLTSQLSLGALAGAAAAVAMTLTTLMLRALAGVPLPVELASDRIVPTLSIQEFNRVVARFGGLVKGKEVAFFIGLGSQLLLGVLGGVAFFLVVRLLRRRRNEPRGRAAVPREPLLVAVPLLVVWLVGLLLLWPVLASNYRGVPARWATAFSAIGLLLSLGAYGAVLVALTRWLLAPAGGPVAEARPRSDGPQGRTVARRALLLGGGSLVLASASTLAARSLYRRATFGGFGYDGLQTRGARLDPVTPNDRFYVVTKNLIDPDVDRALWRLEVVGVVERPHTYAFDELSVLSTATQLTTLECISNPVGGHLISNAVWQGVPLATILRAAGPRPDAALVVLHGADGYVHTVPMDKAMDPNTLVALGMNGVPLPRRHGYPARVIVPGGFGEVSVKWVDRIEVSDHAVLGYYEKQGWKAQFVPTMSRIDRPGTGQPLSLASSPIDVGGVAFAADRGISAVEFSPDGGGTWVTASIDYGSSRLSWTLWSYPWRPSRAGSYRLMVRATDATGAPQTATEHGPAPAGATGYHQVDVDVV